MEEAAQAVLKPHTGEKVAAFRHYPRLGLCYPLVNQEELRWLQQRADVAPLVLQGRIDAGTKLAEHAASFLEALKVTPVSSKIRGSCRCLHQQV